MRKLLLSLMLAMTLAIGSAATGSAATAVASPPSGTYIDAVVGIETALPTVTTSPFAGYASGDLPGFWTASVIHDQLLTTITGGKFKLYSRFVVSGFFKTGTIALVSGGSCTQSSFLVDGTLTLDKPKTGTGRFKATLTHYGYMGLGGCHIFFATIHGIVTLTLF
jgi:hypothetical protein